MLEVGEAGVPEAVLVGAWTGKRRLPYATVVEKLKAVWVEVYSDGQLGWHIMLTMFETLTMTSNPGPERIPPTSGTGEPNAGRPVLRIAKT